MTTQVPDSDLGQATGNSGTLLRPEVVPRSSISPTPRSARGHTPSSVRFSEAAESYSYSSTFEDVPTDTRTGSQLDDLQCDTGVTGRTSYTDTFVSDTSLAGAKPSASLGSLSRKSYQSVDDSSIGASYSDTFEATSTGAVSQHQPYSTERDSASPGYSLYSSGTDRDSQSTVKSVRDSHRWLRTEDTRSSLPSRYDYTDSFETSDLSPSDEESDIGAYTISEDDARYEFIRRLLGNLRGKTEDSVRQSAGSISQHSQPTRQDHTSVDAVTSAKYCKQKIKLLKRKKKYGSEFRDQTEASRGKEEKVSVTEYGFHPSIIDKLKTKSFRAAMEMASKAEIHEPRHCNECREVLHEIEGREQEKNFIRGKMANLQRKTMEDKISDHLANMDSITLIANILRDLPKQSDSPSEISRRLNRPLEEHQAKQTPLTVDASVAGVR